jgi:hypothetical protein
MMRHSWVRCPVPAHPLTAAQEVVWVRLQVLTATIVVVTVILDVSSCSLIEVYRCFRGSVCITVAITTSFYQTTRHNIPEDSHLQEVTGLAEDVRTCQGRDCTVNWLFSCFVSQLPDAKRYVEDHKVVRWAAMLATTRYSPRQCAVAGARVTLRHCRMTTFLTPYRAVSCLTRSVYTRMYG